MRYTPFLFLALCSVATAQPVQPDPSRDTVSRPTKTYESDVVLIEAMRYPIAADSLPYSLSIARYAPGRQGLGLGDILQGVPGVQTDNRYNHALGDRISIRGFGARTQFGVRGIRVIADGIPLTFADGQSALEIIDPGELLRAEIVRGPASTTYGNSAGGVIVLRSHLGMSGLSEAFATTRIGGDGQLEVSGRASMSLSNGVISASYSRFTYDGYRAHSTTRSDRALASAIVGTHDNWIRVSGGWVDFSADNPGSLTREAMAADPRQAFATNVNMATGKSGSQWQIGAGWNREFGGETLLDAFSIDLHGIGRRIENPIVGRIIDLDRLAGGGRILLRGAESLVSTTVSWRIGAEAEVQFDDRQNHANVSGTRGALSLDQEEQVIAIGYSLALGVPLSESMRIDAGVRYDHATFKVEDRLVDTSDPNDSGERTMDAIDPTIGIVWSIDEDIDIYANVATAFETPTTTELANRPSGAGGFNPELDPQRSLTGELGGRARHGESIDWNLALFWTRVTGALIPFETPDDPGRNYFRNAGSATHRGLELALRLRPIKGLNVTSAFTLLDARYDDYAVDGSSFAGNQIPGIAPVRLDASIGYTHTSGWYLAFDGRVSSSTPVDDANSDRADAYGIVGVRAGNATWTIFEEPFPFILDLSAGVSNLFDKQYASSVTINAAGKRFFEPGAGRTVYAAVRIGVRP